MFNLFTTKDLKEELKNRKIEDEERLAAHALLTIENSKLKDEIRKLKDSRFNLHINVDGVDDVTSGMSDGEIQEFLSDIHDIYTNKSFRKLADFLTNMKANILVNEARDSETMSFFRGNISGVHDFYAEAQRLSSIFNEGKQVQDKYDKSEII